MTKIAVHVPTIEDEKRLAELYEKVGWVWVGGESLTENLRWEEYRSQTCIEMRNGFRFSSRKWYEEDGYTIITIDEAEKRLKEMYPDKFKDVNIQRKWKVKKEVESTDGLIVTETAIEDGETYSTIYTIEEAQRTYLRLKSALNQHKKYFSKKN